MNINEMISFLPNDTQQKVEEAKKQFNRIIREAIRQETRLRLMTKDESILDDNDSITQRVAIKTTTDYPIKLDNFVIPEKYRIAALLSQIKHELIKLKESSREVTGFIVGFQEYDEIFEVTGGGICYAEEEADYLIKLAEEYDFVKELLKIDVNILGSYSYNTVLNKPKHTIFTNENLIIPAEINLYWAVIGLVSASIGVSIQSLTSVVLTHELAHAYTHLGCDIDGNRWSDESFYYTDSDVKEGLAQYYTEKVALKLKYKIPDILTAYEKLLDKQSNEYLVHKKWIEKMNIKPEIIRTTLVNHRKEKAIDINEFEHLLETTRNFSNNKLS